MLTLSVYHVVVDKVGYLICNIMFGHAGGVYYKICYPVIERPPVC